MHHHLHNVVPIISSTTARRQLQDNVAAQLETLHDRKPQHLLQLSRRLHAAASFFAALAARAKEGGKGGGADFVWGKRLEWGKGLVGVMDAFSSLVRALALEVLRALEGGLSVEVVDSLTARTDVVLRATVSVVSSHSQRT